MMNIDINEDVEIFSSDFIDDFPSFSEDDDFNHSLWQDFDDSDWRPNDSFCEFPTVSPMSANERNTEKRRNTSIENVNFHETDSGNFRLQADCDMFSENFYFEPIQMMNGSMFESFIASCEKTIRTSQVYKAYIAYLKNEIGLRYDMFNGEITQDEASIEMHHGPLFTLYDYVKIMIDYCFDNGIPVDTFTIAKMVMNEHACNRVQVVMLTKNNHALVHAGKLHVDFRQCHGNIKEFISIYKQQIMRSPKLKKKIGDYLSSLQDDKFNNVDIITPTKTIDWSPTREYDSKSILKIEENQTK